MSMKRLLSSLRREPPVHLQRCSVHMSSIYRPVNITPYEQKKQAPSNKKKKVEEQEVLSKSLKLMVDNGLIRPSSCFGAYHLLPMALKAMEKLINLVDYHMMSIDCQKIQMPILTSAALWKSTGRLEECKAELMRVSDRHSKEFLLSPTHEEAVCDLIKNPPISYRQLPIKLYQITEKFRDEMKPRFGLMRGREFMMKDLYTFDADLEQAKATYEKVNQVYQKLLESLKVNWTMASGSTGSIGGIMSHEFHLYSEIGEDSVLHCSSCNTSFNADLLKNVEENEETLEERATASGGGVTVSTDTIPIPKCINCGSMSTVSSSTSIEVGHSFLLGTKYTKPLDVNYKTESGEKHLLEMGCYGLGISRLLAALIEVKSTEDEIRWPLRIAPYLVSILPPKQGSKEEAKGGPLAEKLYSSLQKILPNDVIYDDRLKDTIGKRFVDNKKLGIPYLVVCGKTVNDEAGPMLELHNVNTGKVIVDNLHNIVNVLYDAKSSVKL